MTELKTNQMLKTFLPIFVQIWKAPDGKKVVALCLSIAFGVPLFLGYYYSDVIKDYKALKIELKEKEKNNQTFVNEYIRKIELCEQEKRTIQEFHINKFNEYRDKQEQKQQEQYKQLESDYKEARLTINNTRRVINKTARVIDKNK